MLVNCSKCGKLHEKYPSKRWCKDCVAAYVREWRKLHREELLVKNRVRDKKRREDAAFVQKERKRGTEYFRKLRHEAIMAYGGYRCACCGEIEPFFLSLDHVNNDGASHRRSLGYKGNGKGGCSRIWKILKDQGYPSGYQVLCMNCNHGKSRNGGICPHQGQTAREFGERREPIIPSRAA